jgi:uncharacterized membrane protein YkvA (DUF1232 family)
LRELRRELHALYLAGKDPRVPWPAKLLVVSVVAYALSPVDLVPDFIPLLGQLDDLVVVPLGILAARRMIPPAVLAECRARADARLLARPQRQVTLVVVLVALAWVAAGVGFIVVVSRLLEGWLG